ncbi:protein brambleberry-like [Dendronephthya gigantea]|uniref:protein brambleberry-like n=1 Tax=Dendronephthya gigantea TaxID=151771 RepID=UPI00106B083D|nr:protein brambleberry-like [Dendronephthya gigantea]
MARNLLCRTIFFIALACSSTLAWWPFEGEKVADPPTEVKDDKGEKTGEFLRNSPVPFEMSVAEQKFLAEAQRYMGDMAALDQCHQVIITRLRKSCHELGEEEIGKLAVSLFNCQSKAEGRALYYCSDEMSLRDCTSGMDPDAWNAYHIISNRARSVCYATRNHQFRLKTEYLVNQLAVSAGDQMNFLERLKVGQENLNQATKGTLDRLTSGHKDLIQEQVKIRSEFGNVNKELTTKIKENVVALDYEKRVIKEAEKQLSSMTEAIANALENTTAELREQDGKRKEEHAAVVEDLEEIKAKTMDTWGLIDEKTGQIRERQDETLDHHQNIMDSLHKLNDTVAFILQSIKEFEERFDVRLSWLASQFGGTENRLGVLTTCFGHFLFFVVMTIFVLFINAPAIPRVVTLILVPFNAWVEIKLMAGMSYMTMTMLILAVIIGQYAFEVAQKKANAFKAELKNLEMEPNKNYINSLPAPETIGPCTPIRPGGGNFAYYNGIQDSSLPRTSSWACDFNRSSTPNPAHIPHHSPSVTFNTADADNAKRHLNLTTEQSHNTTISTTMTSTPSKRNLVATKKCGAQTKLGSACKRRVSRTAIACDHHRT